jgi:hypothetical protein
MMKTLCQNCKIYVVLHKVFENNFCSSLYFLRAGKIGKATGYELDCRGSITDRGKIFLFCTVSRPDPEFDQLLTQWVPGSLSPVVKRQGPEADYSPPSSAQEKNDGAILPLPLLLHGMVID